MSPSLNRLDSCAVYVVLKICQSKIDRKQELKRVWNLEDGKSRFAFTSRGGKICADSAWRLEQLQPLNLGGCSCGLVSLAGCCGHGRGADKELSTLLQ